MAELKIKGDTSGSVSLVAPTSGSDVSLTLPSTTMNLGSVLDSKLDLAGGKILQIVRATDSTERTTTSTSFVDANLSVTITPTKSTSAVILIANIKTANGNSTTNNKEYLLQITDSSNNAIAGAESSSIGVYNNAGNTGPSSAIFHPVVMIGYATPATTSATTYKVRFCTGDSATTIYLRNNQQTATMYAIEVSA